MEVVPVQSPGSTGGVLVIEPRPMGVGPRLREVWRYRRLLTYFGKINLRKMYANTWLGVAWVPLRPILTITMQVAIFGGLLKAPSNGIPYFIFFATGVAAWEIIAQTWYFGTRSLEMHRRYLKRIHLPRLIPLIAAVCPGFMWATLYGAILTAGLGFYLTSDHHLYLEVGPQLLLTVAGVALIALIALSVSLWTSVYGAQARDPRFLVRHALRVWYYATPVIYPLSALPPRWAAVAQFNPMAAPMEMVRQGLYGAGTVTLRGVTVTLVFIAVVGYGGLRFFARSESKALDYL